MPTISGTQSPSVSDGKYVTPSTPVTRGDTVRVYFTGLGQTTPTLATNQKPVDNENVVAPVIVGINNAWRSLPESARASRQYRRLLCGLHDTDGCSNRPVCVPVVRRHRSEWFGRILAGIFFSDSIDSSQIWARKS